MALPAGYIPSRYVGALEVVTVRETMLYSKKHLRKWENTNKPHKLTNRLVRTFQGRLKGKTKYIHSSPILRIDPAPDDTGHKIILCENGNWYRAEVVLDKVPVRLRATGELICDYEEAA